MNEIPSAPGDTMASVITDEAATCTPDAWETTARRVADLARLETGWDGDGAAAVIPAVIASGVRATGELRRRGYEPPHDVYPALDGGFFLEWQRANGVIERIEFECDGHAQQMVTTPSALARFSSLDQILVA